jgi:hypothetical protein
MARIVPNHSAFRNRNDSRVTLSSSRNAVSFSSARTTKRFPSPQPQSPLMNTVRFILPSDKDEDACRQRQYACNYSRDGKSGDCREADHDEINGKQEHTDVFGEDEVH